jgi:hypothetical protein
MSSSSIAPSAGPSATTKIHSSLWGTDGSSWDGTDPLLPDFTDAGYMKGDVGIPDYPPCTFDWVGHQAFPNDEMSDVAAIRLALNSCPPNTALIIPNGVWVVDDIIEIPQDNIAIRGESRDGAILYLPKTMSEILGTTRITGGVTNTFIRFHGGTQRGIEDITVTFREEQKTTGWFRDPTNGNAGPHWWYPGERAISFADDEHDSWIRNCAIRNSNYAIAVSGRRTKHISILDVVIDHFLLRVSPPDSTVGHMGIYLGNECSFILVHNVIFTGRWSHEFAIMKTYWSVISNVTGFDMKPDHHAIGNYNNLITQIDNGIGGRSFSGDNGYSNTVYWGIKSKKLESYADPSRNCTFVGLTTLDPDSYGPYHHHEYIDPYLLEPANMYLAQMAKKQKVFQPSSHSLALPPPKSDVVFQVLPVDDAYVNRANPNTTYSWDNSMNLKRGNREAYVKFDLSGLTLSANVSKAFFKFYIAFMKTDLMGLQLFEVPDDTWVEDTLTWNNKPSTVGTRIDGTYYVVPSDLPTWIELDITSHFNTEYFFSDKVMSLKLILDGELHKKDAFTSIYPKEGGNPSHLVIHLNENTVAMPGKWLMLAVFFCC